MLYREISRVLGLYLYCLSAAILLPLGFAIYFDWIADPALHPQPHSTMAFIYTLIHLSTVSNCLSLLVGKEGRWGALSQRGALFSRSDLVCHGIYCRFALYLFWHPHQPCRRLF